MNHFKTKKEKGFTIMETLVAIAILLLSITGPMAFSQNGLRAAFYARDQVTAFYLAQDAIEFVKNRRDHNALEGKQQWLDGLVDRGSGYPCGKLSRQHSGCSVDTTKEVSNSNPEKCLPDAAQSYNCLDPNTPDGSNDGFLKINTTGQFGFEGEDSIYSRLVVIKETVPNVEAQVSVTIRWKSHEAIGIREITVVEYIYNLGNAWGLTE